MATLYEKGKYLSEQKIFIFGSLFLGLLFFQKKSFAQENVQRFGLMPQFAISAPIGKRGSFNANFTPIIRFYESNAVINATKIQRLDAQFSLAVNLTNNVNFAIGYLVGGQELNSSILTFENRLWQQIGTTHRSNAFRLYTRLRAEQRFTQDEIFFLTDNLVHRFRFLLGGDYPFSGQKIDVREFYGHTFTEILHSRLSETWRQNEFLAYTSVGYVFTKNYRLETGIEYRQRNLDVAKNKLESYFLRISFLIRR